MRIINERKEQAFDYWLGDGDVKSYFPWPPTQYEANRWTALIIFSLGNIVRDFFSSLDLFFTSS